MDIQKKMQRLLEHMVEEGKERGIQIAVYHHGELIVDAWAGIADSRTGRRVDRSTLFPVFSVTKGIAATVIHLLAEQKKLDYDRRICELWPEFANQGKEQVTIRHALNHTAGLHLMPEGADCDAIMDWDAMCALIAAQKPQSAAGERRDYHAVTYGWIIGEIARRADGRPFARIMKEELCDPLGIADLYVGIPADLEERVAFLEEPGIAQTEAPPAGPQAIPGWLWPLHEWMNRAEAHSACIPASTGIMSAHALALHYAALLPGGVNGVELLAPARMRLAVDPLILADGVPQPMGLGYALGTRDGAIGPGPAAFGHGGYGGSIGFADPDHHLAVGLVHNLFSPCSGIPAIINELKQSLGISWG
ncbi:MAG: class beta-lactamase-related serine hydrolase [Paenibacillaceae bacterium]|jgi:CubicO group peptidase (beta-lactamase class C family)|nr:class beta-lactamase-related serine hydrolase [Paenibacillaceae bacterium]